MSSALSLSIDDYPACPAWVSASAPIVRRLPAGRYRLMNRLCQSPPRPFWLRLPTALGGLRVVCDLRDSISRETCFVGRYEPVETAIVQAILQPGSSFIDVGANWGYFTLVAASRVGSTGQVLSLEPDPRLFGLLQLHIKANQLAQVNALCCAASNQSGVLTLLGFHEQDGNFGLSRIGGQTSNAPAHHPRFEVETRRLDDILSTEQSQTVDLLKMDIEGAEVLALPGLSESLRKGLIRRLLLEVHPRQITELGGSVSDIIQLLTDCGYRGWSIDHGQAAHRSAAYAKRVDPANWLRPLDPTLNHDDWPHWLWVAPGESQALPLPARKD